MKRNKFMRIACAAALLILSVSLAGCAKDDVPVEIDVSSLVGDLLSKVSFADQLSEVDDYAIENIYSFKSGDVSEQSVYLSSGATAEEIAVFKAADADKVQAVKEAVTQRVEDQKISFKDYVPAEMSKLNDPIITVVDQYVILCITDDKETAKKVIVEYI